VFRLIVWALYFNGVSLHILLRAKGSIKSRSNSIHTFRTWWELNWRDLGWELFLDGVALMFWEVSPQLVGQVVKVALPITYATAPVMGFAVDRFLHSSGFIVGLTNETPRTTSPPTATATSIP